METLLVIIYILCFAWLILRVNFFRFNELPRVLLLAAFLAKVLCGFAMAYIYTYHYPVRKDADIFRYFDDSKVLYESFFTHPRHFAQMFFGIDTDEPYLYGYYDRMICWDAFHTNIVIRFNALLRFISMGYYSVHAVITAFLSFLGLTAIYRVFYEMMGSKKLLAAVLLFFTPSLLFWTSGVLKESILLFALGLLFYFSYRFLTSTKLSKRTLVLILFLVILTALSKPYVLVAFIPCISGWYLSKRTGKVILSFLLVFGIALALALLAGMLNPSLNLAAILSKQHAEFYKLAIDTRAGSLINSSPLDPTMGSLLGNIPGALFNVLTEPWFFTATNPLSLLAAIENEILIALLCISLYCFDTAIVRNDLFLFSTFFVLLVFTVIGLSTPVAGAIVRYKTPALPFLIGACLMMADDRKLFSLLSLKNKAWRS